MVGVPHVALYIVRFPFEETTLVQFDIVIDFDFSSMTWHNTILTSQYMLLCSWLFISSPEVVCLSAFWHNETETLWHVNWGSSPWSPDLDAVNVI
jgi:hypothetical protein